MFTDNRTSLIDLNDTEAKQFLAQHANDRKEVADYSAIFAAIPYRQVFDQIYIAAKQKNANAIEAGLSLIVSYNDDCSLMNRIEEITPIIADDYDDALQRRMLDIILSIAKLSNDTRLKAYSKSLLVRRIRKDSDAYLCGDWTTLRVFISFKDFCNSTIAEGEDPKECEELSFHRLYTEAERYKIVNLAQA